MHGAVNEICIYLKPLGINAFLTNPLSYYYDQEPGNFDPYPDFNDKMKMILNYEDDDLKLRDIENYFITHLTNFKHTILENALQQMFSTENENATIKKITDDLKISRKTLHLYFRLHMCKTPSEFKKIIRFRQTIDSKTKPGDTNLTGLAYTANYYDQSHMIKDFKKLTGLSPKTLFKDLKNIDSDNIRWIF